jgi:hypothetical protein
MENKTRNTIMVIVLLLTLLGLLIYFSSKIEHSNFNTINFDDDSTIVYNKTGIQYYDTIIKVGLHELGIKNIEITVDVVPETSQKKFEQQGGEKLVAHLREYLGNYFLFIIPNDRNTQINVIAHELIHLKQYEEKDLIYENNVLTWKGVQYDLYQNLYNDRPWEDDAYSKELELETKIKNVLYSKEFYISRYD